MKKKKMLLGLLLVGFLLIGGITVYILTIPEQNIVPFVYSLFGG